MKRLFKFFILLNVIVSIFAACPDRPVIPNSSITNGLLITPTSEGISNFPISATMLSVTMTVTPNQECKAGSTFHLLAMGLTPPGSSTQEYFTASVDCDTLELRWGGWLNFPYKGAFPSGLGPISLFFRFDLKAKTIRWEYQSENNSLSFSPLSVTISSGMSFDENTQFYLCSDKSGASTSACTISEFLLEYPTSQVPWQEYGHFAGKDPSSAAFYPLTDGPATSLKSYTNSEIQADSGYFGDHPTNPTPGTSPTWDSSNAFVTITPGQFLTFPLPSFLHGLAATTTHSFSVFMWIKIRELPTPTSGAYTTIFSTHSADEALSGYSMGVTSVGRSLGFFFSVPVGMMGMTRVITLNTWGLFGFTASMRIDQKNTEGNYIYGAEANGFYQIGSVAPFDLSVLSLLRIGGRTNSFGGDVSFVRIMTPGGANLCSTLSNIELGAGDFALDCSETSRLSSADGKCYESCPSGTRSASTEIAPLCLSCSFHCVTCDSIQCFVCDEKYILYQGICLDSCPEKTYFSGSTCEDCPTNCRTCDETKCFSCDPNHFLYQGKCLDSCPEKTYSTESVCQDCPMFCQDCDSTQCLTCEDDSLIYQGKCFSTCPDKTYSTGSACENCSTKCKKCESKKCLACEADTFLYQGSCLDSCPDKTYSASSTCKDCQTYCQSCNSEQCLTCETNYLLYEGNCREYCPDKTYSTGLICEKCPTNCKECNSIKCLTCNSDYFLYQEKCVDLCPDSMYSTGSVCEDCPVANCKTCESNKCLVCLENHVLYQGSCLNSCPEKTYSTSSECQNCATHCETCNDKGCLTCETNYLFYEGECFESCPLKTYVDQNTCIACSNHCIDCDIDECKVCDDGYQLDRGRKCILGSSSSQSSSPKQIKAGMSGGAIAGIVCGGIALTAVAGWAFYILRLKKPLTFLQKSSTGFTSINSNSPSPTKLPTPIQTCDTEMGRMIA